jgi:sulfatase maturation enzyme AslB (radical SAM superfamily)
MSTFDMSQESADKALALTFRSPSPAIKIEFQGGEPLLNFALIKYIVERAETLNEIERRDLHFVIATNLALISDEILDYCLEHRILISTSIDGPADLHNRNRPRPGGDSYERAIDGINRVRDKLGRDQVSALMTTTEASLGRAIDIIDEYVRLGFNSVFLRPL